MADSPDPGMAQAREWEARSREAFIGLLGCRYRQVGNGRAVLELAYRPELAQSTGKVFHGGALLALADTAATAASLSLLGFPQAVDQGKNSLTISVSASLMGNISSGTMVAEAVTLHNGRSTQVVETRITDEAGKLLALVTSTHMIVDLKKRN